jgi:hypothetical protein
MHARVYMSIQGSPVELEKFHAKASKVVGGTVRRRLRAGVRLNDVPPDLWESPVTHTSADCAAIRLSELLTTVRPLMLGCLHRGPGLHLVAHVVFELEPGKAPTGVRLPQQVIQQLSEMDAHLDFDVAPPG